MLNKYLIFFLIFITCECVLNQSNYVELISKLIKINDKSFDNDNKYTFPGTYWCGNGNIAPDNNTLGELKVTDSCCREHDKCPDIIRTGQFKYGLNNPGNFMKLSCRCDMKFYYCLKYSKDESSNMVGRIFFNLLGTQCFKYDYPIVGCKVHSTLYPNKCSNYILDKKGKATYQWFDLPDY